MRVIGPWVSLSRHRHVGSDGKALGGLTRLAYPLVSNCVDLSQRTYNVYTFDAHGNEASGSNYAMW